MTLGRDHKREKNNYCFWKKRKRLLSNKKENGNKLCVTYVIRVRKNKNKIK